jgi:hypothetical protein
MKTHVPVFRWKYRAGPRDDGTVVRVCKACGRPYPCPVAKRRFSRLRIISGGKSA